MVSAVIVAAGKGIRMNDTVRKQYLQLAGRPVLSHPLAVFDECRSISKIFIVVPQEDFAYCRKMIVPMFNHKINLVAGGKERQDSVYNGLLAVGENNGIVIIHDGVRPFVNKEMLESCVKGAKKHGACIIGVPVNETLKKINSFGNIEKTIPRKNIWIAQTPQAFRYEIIMKAHENARVKGYEGTDDAFLVEKMGTQIKIITGSKKNIKLTTREDLKLAEMMLQAGPD
ncbi:MAG: 2-C-methyl-D-erythritol 4-phosphate cytidylyltransferase [Thermodesulfobacteriota bacterium]|nr:2-C-methyl-D-erythritol 4-phosphate cytidylyltransferase [Thermodesulfobacteriota bacterium]